MDDPTVNTPGPSPLDDAERSSGERRLRIARRFVLIYVIAIVLAFPAMAVQALVTFPIQWPNYPGWLLAAGVVVSCVCAVLVFRMYRARLGYADRYRRGEFWLSFAVLLAALACYGVTIASGLFLAVWWACAYLVAQRRDFTVATAVLTLLLAVGAVIALVEAPLWELLFVYGYTLFIAVSSTLLNVGITAMWDLARDAHAGRDARTRLAVTEERLRFARDMHDLLGHSLSSIAVKSELAARLAPRDAEQAAAEMLSVQSVARGALREVRAAISGYRDVDLAAELDNVRAVLTAAGTRCTVSGTGSELSAEQRGLAAWVIREGATNVLRHSAAARCDITVRRDGATAIFEVYNDGAAATGGEPPRFGNGLTGLTERLAAAGGTLSAHPTADGGFLLRALLPGSAAEVRQARQEVQEKKGVTA